MLGITNEIGGLKKNKDNKCSEKKMKAAIETARTTMRMIIEMEIELNNDALLQQKMNAASSADALKHCIKKYKSFEPAEYCYEDKNFPLK